MPIPAAEPIVVAPMPTPFAENDAVDYAAIEYNVARWLATPLSGFVLNSENGEEAFLSEAERQEIICTVNSVLSGQKFIVGGIDSPSVTETLRLAESFAHSGAEMVRVRIPRLTSNVRGYFAEVLPRLPVPAAIIHQMAPGMFLAGATPLGAAAEMIVEWMAHDNALAYISSDNLRFEARVRTMMPPQKHFWAPNGSLLLPGAALGASGACLMLGNVLPGECQEVVRLCLAGDLPAAQAIHRRIVPLDWQILSRGAAGIKAVLTLLGYRMGPPRSPTPACGEAAIAEIRAALARVTEGRPDA